MKKVILHCSNSSYGNAALITKWHTLPAIPVTQNGKTFKGNGWNAIGYHFVILNGHLASGIYHNRFDGYLETGRALSDDSVITMQEQGAHTRGQNKDSIGICLVGLSGHFTQPQIQTLLETLYFLEKQFKKIEIFQHSDFDAHKYYCAGLDLQKLLIQFTSLKNGGTVV